jgi:hypothetical protein
MFIVTNRDPVKRLRPYQSNPSLPVVALGPFGYDAYNANCEGKELPVANEWFA